jgi:hypothetical protein
MADKTRENLDKDPNRDMSHVPGTFNPGNQAGKGAEEGEERASDKGAGTKPGRTAAPGEKGKEQAR